MPSVDFEVEGPLAIISLDRPEVRNAVDGPTAEALAAAFRRFDADESLLVAVLTGRGGHFCAGADLKAISAGNGNRLEPEGDGPMGSSRMRLKKPVIAAIEGYAVAGGLELAVWCDLRVASRDAVFGVLCRRWGVPLIDGGTVRLPRLIGQSRALDLILTGREVGAEEAERIGLVNRVAPVGGALAAAKQLALTLARFPQGCLRADRESVYEQWALTEQEALRSEFRGGMRVVASGETVEGATRFANGAGRHGAIEA